jgi:hypothetical protein
MVYAFEGNAINLMFRDPNGGNQNYWEMFMRKYDEEVRK